MPRDGRHRALTRLSQRVMVEVRRLSDIVTVAI